MKFVDFNANYWRRDIGDCTIRALSFGTGYGYFHLAKLLKQKTRVGRGLVEDDGVQINIIENIMQKKLHIIDRVFQDDIYWDFFIGKKNKVKHDVFIDPEVGDTMNEWGDMYEGTGRYIVMLRPPREVKNNDWHCVYLNTDVGKFFDTWNSGNFLVFGAYRITIDKVPEGDPHSRTTEIQKINEYIKTRDKKILKSL